MRDRTADVLALMLGLWLTCFYPLSPEDLSFEEVASVRVFDRHGYLLREVLSARKGRGHWTPLRDISPKLLDAAIVAEDKRFYRHGGVDAFALGRAIWQNFRARTIVSGGSTITQQVIRNLFHYPRTALLKGLEIWYAVRLEHTLDKRGILEQYFNRIPFGNQCFGVEAAAQLYLGKSSQEVTWNEAAFLMALPKSPTSYNPYRNPGISVRRREHILQKLHETGLITADEWDRALHEPLILFPKSSPFKAAHFVEWVMPRIGARTDVRTSLDLPLQEEVEKIIRGHVGTLDDQNVTNAAVLVLHNATGKVLAMAGSVDYFDSTHDGQFNAVFAKRQPGSALKPFTYALAFSMGYTPATLIPDVETVIPSGRGQFTPRNYDNTFHGPVRARVALACSYNVPAVRVAQDVGVPALLSKLRECGLETLTEDPSYYGHGLTLGNGEVTLFELTRAYAALANEGTLRDPTWDGEVAGPVLRRNVFSAPISWMISDILSDAASRAPAFGHDSPLNLPFECAVKTGTSSEFRDNWTIGYTTEYTVGVWAGNFDNKPMSGISGITGAGPIFHDIMMYLYKDRVPPARVRPAGIREITICRLSGDRVSPFCPHQILEYLPQEVPSWPVCRLHTSRGFRPDALSPVFSEWLRNADSRRVAGDSVNAGKELRITYPLNKSRLKIDPGVGRSHQALFFQAIASPAITELAWQLNGLVIEGQGLRAYWRVEKGEYTLKLTGRGPSGIVEDEIMFSVD